MKIHLFFFILLLWVTILTAKRWLPEYGSLDLRTACRLGKGHCKTQCTANEHRIAFCIRPGSHCCI
ncbi:beta-defensin 17 [Cricetulus griseus]|uniref:Beta-defensin n=1 Tax=Cricetulus griseus TaxID=10029 RepID=A0A9J7J1R3_CRIGR|nr:beta-defensin 17 [Cricetulus griseus]XP_027243190.1 beta-defensin 17 [Cricetulus griseus]